MNKKVETKKKSIFSDRKFKYGSLAVGLTIAFVALIVILNVIIYALAYSYGWYIDLTGQQYYGINQGSIDYLDEILTPEVKVKIIFCQAKDRVIDDNAGYYVYRCAETYKKTYPDNISIEFLDINLHPDIANEYTTQLGSRLYTTSVIIETNQTDSFRAVTYDNFFTFDSETNSVYAFNGERRFTSYIMALCTDYPICYFTTGHGETVYGKDDAPIALAELMVDAGFDVRLIDLSKEDIDGNAKVIIINDPVYDFIGGDDLNRNELNKLGRFMSDKGGNAMVFLSPEHHNALTNLKQWLADWGVSVEQGIIKDDAHAITPDALTITNDYPSGTGFAESLHTYIRRLDSAPMTPIKDALAFKALFEYQNGKEVGTVLKSFDTSKLCTDNGDVPGSYVTATLVQHTKTDSSTQAQLNTYLFVSSKGYIDEDYLNSNSYGNRDMLFTLASAMSKKLVPLDIDFKVFANEALDITTAEAYGWSVTFIAIIPLVIAGVGIFVCVRRKHM